MRVILKYDVPHDGWIEMPQDAQLLTARMQDGALRVWALVDPDRLAVLRGVAVVGTGRPRAVLGEGRGDTPPHVATVEDGAFIWHVFDAGEAD